MSWTGGAPTAADRVYANGSASVGTTAAKVCTVPADATSVVVQAGSAAVFVGGPNVAATGTHQGISVAAGATLTVPCRGGAPYDLYAVAAGATTLNWLYPA